MKILINLIIVLITFSTAFSQDVIIFKDGEELACKITEVGVNEIKYKKFPPSETAPIYVEEKSKIFMIKYEDGTKDIFKITDTSDETTEKSDSDEDIEISDFDAALKGEQDSDEFHRSGGNFFLGLVFGILGPIGVAIAHNPKLPDLTRIPEPKLARNHAYLSAYKKKAHRRNVGAAIGGTVLAAVIIIGAAGG